jgi:hypothetical protein
MALRAWVRSSSIPLILLAAAAPAIAAGCKSDPGQEQSSGTTGSGSGSGGAGGSGGGGASSSGTGGTGGSEPPVTVCDPPLVEVAPSGTDDVVYPDSPQAPCGEPCLCSPAARPFVEHVLACDPVTGGFWAPLGSLALRVVGREAGACVIDVGDEVEGGVVHSRCRLPLPIAPWPGIATDADPLKGDSGFLEGIADRCEVVGTCCTLPGCPDPCETTLPDVPLCPPGLPGPSCE